MLEKNSIISNQNSLKNFNDELKDSAKNNYDWQIAQVLDLFDLPFNDLIFKSAEIHRQNHNSNEVQI